MGNTHKIVRVNGHYELYDGAGNFVQSGDTWEECYKDLLEMIVIDAKYDFSEENIREAIAI